MTIRVLHVLNGPQGGATSSAVALMREGKRRESKIEHFVVYPGQLGEKDSIFEGCAVDWLAVPMRTWHRQRVKSLKDILRWAKVRFTPWYDIHTRRVLRDLVARWDIDVIHTNTSVIREGALVAQELGLPHLWHIRERIGRGGFKEFPGSDQQLVEYIANLSIRVPVISRYVQDVFTVNGHFGVTELVFDGVDVDLFQDPSAHMRGRLLRASWGVPDEMELVGMVGGLTTSVKGHCLFLEMAQEIVKTRNDVYFVILGRIPAKSEIVKGSWAGKVLGEIENGGLKGRVVLPGFVDDPPAVWAAMDVYAHPCAVEGFSRAILEAMAAGVPVVAAEAGGNPEAIAGCESGILLPSSEPGEWAGAMVGLLNSPDYRMKMVQQAAKRVVESFPIGLHYDVMQDIFEAVALRRAG